PADWPMHGRDPGAQRFSPLKQINTENVSKLKLAWIYDTPAEVPPPASVEGAPAENAPAANQNAAAVPSTPERPRPIQSEATPLVIDGVMYLASAYNRVVALDADTGKEI